MKNWRQILDLEFKIEKKWRSFPNHNWIKFRILQSSGQKEEKKKKKADIKN